MKEGLMWFIVVAILGTIIPSKGWLAVFGIVVLGLLGIICTLDKRARGLQRVQEVPNSDCPPPQISDRFAKCITLVIISAFFLGIAFMVTVGVCQYFDFTPKNHREAICLFGLIVNMIVWPIAFFSKRQS